MAGNSLDSPDIILKTAVLSLIFYRGKSVLTPNMYVREEHMLPNSKMGAESTDSSEPCVIILQYMIISGGFIDKMTVEEGEGWMAIRKWHS